ncbi:hypothetical protein [Corynebacterium tuberculostearicum]|uniref:hypothetical protein n=1 Tax=Corynebacterium tuberculostearicum TaxID=38304 RepID=UPI00264A2E9D|nr:hypothetical protein [Corynebacterium tuberculostearicum]MDV2433416.1 hypothetical protein [Corynebacterium tuberculostearicum]WKE60493.1 hypothetical protein KAH61_05115 [Corynebacterium tuberculostearicum]
MTATARYSDPFTSADREVEAPEGAEFVVVRKRGEAAVDGEVMSFYGTREEVREAVMAGLTEEFKTAVDNEPIYVTHAGLRSL